MKHARLWLGVTLGLLAANAPASDFALVYGSAVPAGANARGTRLVDIDGDGWLDLVSVSETQGTLNVLRNLGADRRPEEAFRFGEREVYHVGERPTEIGIGDLDGDGVDDVVVAVREDDQLVVFLNQAGTLVEATRLDAGEGPYDVIIHDIDGDGDNDIIVAERVADQVSLFISDGDGHGYVRRRFSTVSEARQIALGDFNGDGQADIAVAGSRLQLHLNDGGNFSRGQSLDLDGQLQNVVVGDFDSNGHADLVVTRVASQTIHLLLADGNGRFTTEADTGRHEFFTGEFVPNVVTAADLDQDGHLDVLVSGRSATRTMFFQGTGHGDFVRQQLLVDTDSVSALNVADLDRDGKNDLAVTRHQQGTTVLYRGHGEQPFDQDVELVLGGVNGVAILDRETAGSARVLVSDIQRQQVHVLAATARDFTAITSVPVAAIPSLLRSRALADGSSEVFVAANAGSDIARFRLDASNTVQALPPVAVGSGFSAWLPGSFSAAGERELLVVVPDGSLELRQLDDTGDAIVSVTAGDPSGFWEAADLDNDGIDEVIAVSASSLNVMSLQGATLLADDTLALPATPDRIRLLDVDGDGDLDLVLVYGAAHSVHLHRNDNGSLDDEPQVITVNGRPDDVAVPDLDGDGRPDLAISDISNNRVELRAWQDGDYSFLNVINAATEQPSGLLAMPSLSAVSPLLVNHGGQGKVRLHRRSDNRRPLASDLAFETADDEVLLGYLEASDPDGDQLQYVVMMPAEQGEFELLDPVTGRFRYVPEKGFDGQVHINYAAVDATTTSELAVVKITVNRKGGGGGGSLGWLLLLSALLPMRGFRK